jgi:hypothetical protein
VSRRRAVHGSGKGYGDGFDGLNGYDGYDENEVASDKLKKRIDV